MTPSEYWRERDRQNAAKLFEYSERQGQMVTRWFNRAARDMDAKAREIIRKYAGDNQLTYQQAKAELTDKAALSELLENYEALLAVAPSDPVVNGWLSRLHAAKRINREEFLKAQLNLIATDVFGKYEDATAQTLTRLFEESYYKSLFDQQQLVGFGSSFNRLSTNFIAAATSTAWSGKNYSQAIWGDHRVSLARYLNRIITTGVIEGTSNQMRTAELQKAMSMSAYNARRLIRTEGNYVANRGSLLGYREFGTEQYEFLATLDFKTSVICRDMDGRVFLVADAQQGVNMAPMHPFCRSTSVPYVPDEEFDQDDTRAARDGKGNTYRVPANMKYREWYDQHVKPYKGELLAEQKYKHGRADAAQWARYRDTLGDEVPRNLDKFQDLKYTDADGYNDLKREYRHTNYYSTHLTHKEQAAISSYVSGGSYNLNARLRDGATLDAAEEALVTRLDAALEKLPVYEGPVIRSMVMDRESLFQYAHRMLAMDIDTLPAYTSASTLPDYHESPNVLVHIQSKTGRDVRMVNKQEGEIVFRRGTKLKIRGVTLQDGVVVIEAEELE